MSTHLHTLTAVAKRLRLYGYSLLLGCMIPVFTLSAATNATSDAASDVATELATGKALDFFNQRSLRSKGAGMPQRMLTSTDLEIAYRSANTVTNPVYGFQRGTNGFVLVAHNAGEPVIVGYSTNGTLDGRRLPEALQMLLKSYEQTPAAEVKAPAKLPGDVPVVAPLLTQHLDQFLHPEVGNCYTGCVATAMVQLMAYYKYPDRGVGSNCYTHDAYGQLCASFDSLYNWVNPTQADYQRLSYHMGIACNMDYCGSSDGSAPLNFSYYDVLQRHFKYYTHRGSTESYYIYNELDQHRPVYIELYGDPGHAVILDGYDNLGYFHIDFGWGGNENGYFMLNSNSTFEVGYRFGTNIGGTVFASPSPFEVNVQDSLALIALHEASGFQTGWDVTKPVVNWRGVLVMNGRVIGLTLDKALNCPLPETLSQLTALRRLNLRGYLERTLPPFLMAMTDLRELSLNVYNPTQVDSLPANIGNLSQLEVLDVKVKGHFPASFSNLTKLKVFRSRDSGLTGEIPPSLFAIPGLEELVLGDNQLTGSIPASIGQLTGLTKLWLQNNRLSGPLPEEIGNLTNLTDLWLSNNQFSGPLPERLGDCAKLSGLYIENNQFEGKVPESICDISRFTNLNISNNRFTALPDSLGRMVNLQEINAANNLLDSLPTSISRLSKLFRLDVRDNRLKTLPDMGAMPALWDVNLSNNLFETLPSSLANLTKVSELYVSNNRLKEIPSFIGRLSTLKFASFARNQLSTLPTSMVALTNLKHFDARHNHLEGPLPQLDHLELLTFDVSYNRLRFEDLRTCQLPDNTIHTDDYEFSYYDQASVALTDTLFLLDTYDTLRLDARQLTGMTDSTNVYCWYKGENMLDQQWGEPVLTLSGQNVDVYDQYWCRVTNPHYVNLVLRTDTLLVASPYDSAYLAARMVDTGTGERIVSDAQVKLWPPDGVRGVVTWQTSLDSINWAPVASQPAIQTLGATPVTVDGSRLTVEPTEKRFFRFQVKEWTCDPILSDVVTVLPYGIALVDTVLNVTDQEVTIVHDSLHVTLPAGLAAEDVRLSIKQVLNPPAPPDSVKMSTVFDVTLSSGDIFNLPLQIRFTNLDKAGFDLANIDRYKAGYYDEQAGRWVYYDDGAISLKDSSLVFNTYHLTKLAWFEFSHGSYTHRLTKGRVNVIYKYGVGSEDNFYQAYEMQHVKGKTLEAWQDTLTDPDSNGNPYMIQDIAHYMNEIMNTFESLGLETPSLRFNVYVGCIKDGKGAGVTDAGSYLAGRGYFYVDPTFASEPADLRSTLSHEYMHYTQDYYMVMLTHNYFWAEATAPMADRMVWDETVQEEAEPEGLLRQGMIYEKGFRTIYDALARSWDDYTNLPLLSKFLVESADANLASTFLHYLRSYRPGERLKPEVLLKESPWTGSWLSYLDSYIQTYLKSTVGAEYDAFVRFLLEGSEKKFTLLAPDGPDPLVNLDQSNKFITQKYYVIKKGEKNKQDKLNLELPYLSAKLVQLSNYNPRTKLVVKYKRKTETNENLKVYLGKYDPKTKQMVFEDHSLKDTSAFLLDVYDYSAEGKPYVAYLLFVNTSTDEPVTVDYDLTVIQVPDLRFFDDFSFTTQWGGSNLPIHRLALGETSELTTLTIIPVVYRIYAEQYYSTLYWESRMEGDEIRTRAWSDWMEQEVTYNYMTGHLSIYERENWGGLGANATLDDRVFTLEMEGVWFDALPYGGDSRFVFRTDNTAQTQAAIKSMTYIRRLAHWNDALEPPGYNPVQEYKYMGTEYPDENVRFHLFFW
ncbi:MAG: hypothetical protein GXY09_00140 [Bacteroidales bacterium]|nr:hypothetical protein [Bacteroidales bacterium]